MIATVKELSTAKSSKGTPYLKGKFATPDGDRTVLIWDSSDRATVQQAFEGGRSINLPIIKEGDYWNLEKNKAITFADNPAGNPVQPVFPATSAPQPPVAGNGAVNPAGPPYSRDGVIEAQVAIKAAVELMAAGKLAVDNPIAVKVFKWLNSKIPD